MGYRGKVEERARARELRARAWTLQDIADELGVSKSSVSLWVRDVEFTPQPRPTSARTRGPNRLQIAKEREIDLCLAAGIDRIGTLSDRDLLIAGTALYAGEGAKRDGKVKFTNTSPEQVALFCRWLRRFFDVDEARLRVYLYLHRGLDLDAATSFWAEVTGIPPTQFGKAYRATPDAGIRNSKHVNGCATVSYSCSRTHREIMGLVRALLSGRALPT